MKTNTWVSLVPAIAFLQVLGRSRATLLGDHVEGCQETARTAQRVSSDPGEHLTKTFRDIHDFKNYPDKSKGPQKTYTWTELASLDGEDGRHLCLVIDRKVYDVTDFADQHPAGPRVLKKYVGRDATAGFQLCGIPPALVTPALKVFLVGQLASWEQGTYEDPDQS